MSRFFTTFFEEKSFCFASPVYNNLDASFLVQIDNYSSKFDQNFDQIQPICCIINFLKYIPLHRKQCDKIGRFLKGLGDKIFFQK